jgi:16S rRNA (guanine1516-N2)-methyltransferase
MIRAIKSGKEKEFSKLHVLDATAGLAQDAFVIAGMGCHVTLVERNPIMYSLITSGLFQGHRDVEISKILDRMQAKHEDSIAYLKSLLEPGKERPDVVYLDPMYPSKKKLGSLTKKGMFVTRYGWIYLHSQWRSHH